MPKRRAHLLKIHSLIHRALKGKSSLCLQGRLVRGYFLQLLLPDLNLSFSIMFPRKTTFLKHAQEKWRCPDEQPSMPKSLVRHQNGALELEGLTAIAPHLLLSMNMLAVCAGEPEVKCCYESHFTPLGYHRVFRRQTPHQPCRLRRTSLLRITSDFFFSFSE